MGEYWVYLETGQGTEGNPGGEGKYSRTNGGEGGELRRDLLSNMLSLGLGVVAISKEQVEKMVDRLVKRGEMAPEEAKKMVSEIMEKGREGREQLAESIRKQLKRALSELELPTRDDLNALKDRIQVLEERLGQLEEEGDF